MRFTLIKDLKEDMAMKPLLNGLLLFILLYFIADFFVVNASLGLLHEDIKMTLFGNADEFVDPMDKSVFLEYIHGQIFFIMMILLTLSTVYVRLCSIKRYSIIVINTLMLSALLTLISLFLSYFYTPNLLNLYVVSFFIWHILAFIMALHSLWNLNFATSI
ncbi:hypothetical protein JHD49_06215 [Sulfurimonas sp. SAG-AH-194-C21]|nr:hypothetical protein [Sulfurimonas sp. SAG-AH-194-C21]MDF1883531.1 hypothetical protein [Sulfurimonas sp. SAG-AH-194-C21]